MIIDRIFRIVATTLNTVVFAYILYTKIQSGAIGAILPPHVFLHVGISALLGSIFFFLLYKLIADQHTLRSIPGNQEHPTRDLELNSIINAIKNTDIPESVRDNLVDRLRHAECVLGKDHLPDALWRQYQLCVDNEKFYERIAWQVGSIFVPVGLGLGAVCLTRAQSPQPTAIIVGFVLFATWVFLFRRFRSSIRLFRECAEIIENIMGMFVLSYVYSFSFQKYGPVIRVWPYLVTLLGVYFNYMIAIAL